MLGAGREGGEGGGTGTGDPQPSFTQCMAEWCHTFHRPQSFSGGCKLLTLLCCDMLRCAVLWV